jgi:2-methylcitrate dehydratase PrpD
LLERVTWAGCAGHVLDYDDTYSPGLVHASAPVAPVALLLGAELELDIGTVLDAYAAGFETTAALARAGHPALYERGWHPTAVCGTAGAAVAAARLLSLSEERTNAAVALALLRAGGMRAAFGSDGKALQVGMASAAGLHAAQIAEAGARVPLDAVAGRPDGFAGVFGTAWPPPDDVAAVHENWIKAYPCCLATHSVIEAAVQVRDGGPLADAATVVVHPLARSAAALDEVSDGLQAKFSIPYLAAFTLLHGAPRVSDFNALDDGAQILSRRISVQTDARVAEMEARLAVAGQPPARVAAPLGSPGRPMDAQRLREKLRELAGVRLDGALEDASAPASVLVAAAGLA